MMEAKKSLILKIILKWTFYKGSEGKTKLNKITHLWVFVCWRHGGIWKIITQNKTNKTLHLFAPLNHLVPGGKSGVP